MATRMLALVLVWLELYEEVVVDFGGFSDFGRSKMCGLVGSSNLTWFSSFSPVFNLSLKP